MKLEDWIEQNAIPQSCSDTKELHVVGTCAGEEPCASNIEGECDNAASEHYAERCSHIRTCIHWEEKDD